MPRIMLSFEGLGGGFGALLPGAGPAGPAPKPLTKAPAVQEAAPVAAPLDLHVPGPWASILLQHCEPALLGCPAEQPSAEGSCDQGESGASLHAAADSSAAGPDLSHAGLIDFVEDDLNMDDLNMGLQEHNRDLNFFNDLFFAGSFDAHAMPHALPAPAPAALHHSLPWQLQPPGEGMPGPATGGLKRATPEPSYAGPSDSCSPTTSVVYGYADARRQRPCLSAAEQVAPSHASSSYAPTAATEGFVPPTEVLHVGLSKPFTRAERVARYLEKKRARKISVAATNVVRYVSRSSYALVRPRIKGRFVKQAGEGAGEEAGQA